MTWLIVLAIGAGTFLIRASMLAFSTGRLPQHLTVRLALVAPAALGALTISAISHDLDIAVVGACAVGFGIVRRTGNVNHALIVGFPALWLLAALTG
jgi:branched-subunit amino acid transport protein